MSGDDGCCKKTNIYVYCSHFLSAWGDRMWSFGVGIFLIDLSPESLQLTAVYGLCMGFSVLLLGAFIGDIVDNTPRLKAAQVALVFQNSFVVASAVLIYLYMVYKDEVDGWGGWSRHTFYAITITLSVLSLLNSLARSLAVEKDWIVEICKDDTDALASMTATLRRIDLTTQVLAPVATGVVMGTTGVETGALFIGGWNLLSVILEYYLLWKVYSTVPALRAKKNFIKSKGISQGDEPKGQQSEMETAYTAVKSEVDDKHDNENEDVSDENLEIKPMTNTDRVKRDRQPTEKRTCCSKMLVTIERLYKGWPLYAKYPVAHAGMGLACMYLTVLGLDNITVGYAKMQGITEVLLGALQGVAAFFGIAGTLFYPLMRKRLGLIRTGIFGFSLLVLSIVPCVISVWMPGSPFDLSKGYGPGQAEEFQSINCTEDSSQAVTISYHSATTTIPVITKCLDPEEKESSDISIWMLLAGIVTARFGLWIADLSITQLFLEEVKEEERGKVNGVQRSLNQLLDLLKFVMVIAIPYQHQFGLAVIISFSSICAGWCFYAYYLRKMRGHLLPHCSHYNKNGHVPASSADENNGGPIDNVTPEV